MFPITEFNAELNTDNHLKLRALMPKQQQKHQVIFKRTLQNQPSRCIG